MRRFLRTKMIGTALALGLFGAISAGAASYFVVPGDTLWKIATSHGLSLAELIDDNHLTSTWIYPGQHLMLGDSQTGTYRVLPGDTMWIIAHKLGLSLRALVAANPQLSDPAQLRVGQTLHVPGAAPSGGYVSNPPVVTPPSTQPTSGTTTLPTGGTNSAYETQVLNLVNQERQAAGVQALSGDAELTAVAEAKARDLVENGYFSHTSPTLGSPFDQLKRAGVHYTSAGENIAKGQTSPSAVMAAWMNSPGHRANILHNSYQRIGVGYYSNGRTRAWVQLFVGNAAYSSSWS